ncbi:cerebellin-3-like [Mya arenaria]|uniref:cerebellin-3-like n=1 Tax=Mya arenaria TaxID=6604 RepID=UPI0022E36900|nr:cerebellin-3-like [Mya arenaria]
MLMYLLLFFGAYAVATDTSSLDSLENRMAMLEKQGTEQKALIEVQTLAMERQDARIRSLEADVKRLQTFAGEKQAELETSQRSKRFVVDNMETAAFHAVITGGQVSHNHISQGLVFPSVTLNAGGGYDATTGVFTCPMNGIYVFSTSIMAISSAQPSANVNVHVDIMKNGVEIGAAFASGSSGAMEQGSVSVAVNLVTGDRVHVAFQRHEDVHIWGDRLTSFMGALVTPL